MYGYNAALPVDSSQGYPSQQVAYGFGPSESQQGQGYPNHHQHLNSGILNFGPFKSHQEQGSSSSSGGHRAGHHGYLPLQAHRRGYTLDEIQKFGIYPQVHPDTHRLNHHIPPPDPSTWTLGLSDDSSSSQSAHDSSSTFQQPQIDDIDLYQLDGTPVFTEKEKKSLLRDRKLAIKTLTRIQELDQMAAWKVRLTNEDIDAYHMGVSKYWRRPMANNIKTRCLERIDIEMTTNPEVRELALVKNEWALLFLAIAVCPKQFAPKIIAEVKKFVNQEIANSRAVLSTGPTVDSVARWLLDQRRSSLQLTNAPSSRRSGEA